MYRYLSLFIFVLSVNSLATAQDFIFDPNKKGKTDVEVYAEGEEKEKKKLLLISYMPNMHVPDPAGDVELFMKSGQDMHRLYDRFRQAMDYGLLEKCREGFEVISLLRTNEETKADLHRVYGAANYAYDDRPTEIGEPKKYGKLCCLNVVGGNNKKPSKHVETGLKDGQLSSRDIDRSLQYMNVSIPDTTLLAYLTNKYEADMLLFVNQFELKKKYAEGSDVAYRKYGREVMIHYSIFDKDGLQLYGNSSKDLISERQDNINEIISRTFPVISADVFEHIPGAHNHEAAGKLQKSYQKKAENQDILGKD